MVAVDFPPCKSAGVQRTLKFAEYLTEMGWQPIILTVNEGAYDQVDNKTKIPESIKHVYRSFSFNASRDFAIKGKHLSIMKQPDKWWTWRYTAIPLGKKIIDELQPDVIWSTYPVSTAHHVAYKLSQYANIPWIADYRDPLQCRYDQSAKQLLNLDKSIENRTFKYANRFVFTCKRASLLYQCLFPDVKLSNFHVIENGFDEANFQFNEIETTPNIVNRKFTLLHSGAIYKNGRDPEQIFKAIAILKKQGVISVNNFQLVFRGFNGSDYHERLNELEINELVQFKASISYVESLKEMMTADALLLIQGAIFVNQIPGKLFEYIRSHLPVIALTPNDGATAELLNEISDAYVGENAEKLAVYIEKLLDKKPTTRKSIEQYSRVSKTQELANVLNSLLPRSKNVE